MLSFVLASLMESPVLVEVATGAKGAQSQYGLGAVQTPAGTGYRHTVFHQVPAGTFDNACGDGQALGKVAIITKIGRMIGQVTRAIVHRLSCFNRMNIKPYSSRHLIASYSQLTSQALHSTQSSGLTTLQTSSSSSISNTSSGHISEHIPQPIHNSSSTIIFILSLPPSGIDIPETIIHHPFAFLIKSHIVRLIHYLLRGNKPQRGRFGIGHLIP